MEQEILILKQKFEENLIVNEKMTQELLDLKFENQRLSKYKENDDFEVIHIHISPHSSISTFIYTFK